MRIRFFPIVLLLSLLPLPISASQAEEQIVEIVVVQRDTLSQICKKYLDDAGQWRRIAKLNRLSNPDLIFPGQVLKFPVEILKGTPIDGAVTFVKGDVAARASENDSWHALHMDDRVNEGSGLRTGEESGLEISFEDGATFLLRANTTLQVKTAQKGLVHFMRRLFLQTGRVISRIRAATGRASRVEVHTPSAIAAARGTEYRVSVDPENSTRAEVLEGGVEVAALAKKVMVNAGEGTLVKQGAPPGQPKKLLPPPAPVGLAPLYRTLPLQFRFGAVEGASSYRVMLTRDPDAKDIVKERVIRPDEALDIIGVDDGLYYLRSLSIDTDGLEGPLSGPDAVKVRINPLPPFIESPVHGAKLRTRTVEAKWLKVQDAAGYHLQIAEDKEFLKIVLDKADIKDTLQKTGDLDYKPHYLRLSSVAEDGYEGVWSVAQEFEIIPPPPTPPVENPEMKEKEITIRWADLGKGITYQVQMARDEGFREILLDEKVTKPEVSLEKPRDAGIYYVRVRGIDADEYAGNFSRPQSFEIRKRFPYGVLGALGAIAILIVVIF